MKYVVIERRIEQVWNDGDINVFNRRLEYIPIGDKFEAETWVESLTEKDVDEILSKSNRELIEVLDVNTDNVVKYGNYNPYIYDRREDEYELVYYVRVYEEDLEELG